MQETNKTGKTLLIVVAPDKGLCGGLITNLIKEVLKRDSKKDICLTVGKKLSIPCLYWPRIDRVISFWLDTSEI